MAKIYDHAYFGDAIVSIKEANLSVASSAVLYGLSVYTVFPLILSKNGFAAFCLKEHYARLINSAKIIGIDTDPSWSYEKFKESVKHLAEANQLTETVFIRATIHVSDLVPGTRSRGLQTVLSMFAYEAQSIIPRSGARLKTSVWRRVPDYAIPSRAKVNGAYVNSVLGKQDALDSGYDDCLFLDAGGHVCELSASNIFIVREDTLLTPERSSDVLEGINRRVVLDIAKELGIPTSERVIDLTEVYVADEVFACGTSSYVTPIIEIDARKVAGPGPITKQIQEKYESLFKIGSDSKYLTSL